VSLNHIPVPAVIRVHWRALEHERTPSVQQRAINNVSVAGNPAAVGDASEQVAFLQVEGVLSGLHREQRIPPRGVHNSLGPSGAATRVENEERILRVHPLARAVRALVSDHSVELDVAPFRERGSNLVANPVPNEDVVDDAVSDLGQGRIDDLRLFCVLLVSGLQHFFSAMLTLAHSLTSFKGKCLPPL